jgi:hypothetical protein
MNATASSPSATLEAVAAGDAPGRPMSVERFATAPVLGIAAAVMATMVALATRYGFHRDELYYLWGGEHPAAGYVDHPPLVPLLARLADAFGEHTLLVLRTIAALMAGWLVVAAALIARELGGHRRAQVIAAFAAACVPATRGPAVLYGTTVADAAVWALVLLLVTRLLRTSDRRLWIAIGVATGIGFETKWAIGLLVAGLGIGLLATDRRALLWSPWAVVGGALALALWAPNLWWNATHDWAFLEFQREVGADNGALDKRLLFFPLVLLLAGLAPIIVWLPGWAWLSRGRFRPIAIAAVVVTVVVFLAGGKPYYPAPLILPLLAAGAIVLDRASDARRRVALVVLAITGVITIPFTVPVLPASALDAIKPINPEMGEMIGWPELTKAARDAYAALPTAEREHAVILTGNYGSASALRRFAPELPVVSAHNDLWLEGPPPESATTVLTIGYSPRYLEQLCRSITPIGVVTNDAGLANQEANRTMYRCERGTPWATIWPSLKHYG